ASHDKETEKVAQNNAEELLQFLDDTEPVLDLVRVLESIKDEDETKDKNLSTLPESEWGEEDTNWTQHIISEDSESFPLDLDKYGHTYIEGKVSDEYLPATTEVDIKVYREGETTSVWENTPKTSLLKPYAEQTPAPAGFRYEVGFGSENPEPGVYEIKVFVENPAELKSLVKTVKVRVGGIWQWIGSPGTVNSLMSYDGKLYASTDNGVYYFDDNWVKISEMAICDMQVYGNYLYGFLNFYSSGAKSKVYCYNGSTWTEVGFFHSTIRRLVVAGGNLYALWGYVWRYQGGSNWQPCNWYWFRDLFEHNGQLYAIYGWDYTYLYLYNGENWVMVSFLGRDSYNDNTAIFHEGNLHIGSTGVWRWNGLPRPNDEWTCLTGEGGSPGRIQSLIEYNGKLHAIDYYGAWCYECSEGEDAWVNDGYSLCGTHRKRPMTIHNGKLYAGSLWRYDGD
ncbi:hypothetical protein KAI19_03285, partial [bacterium]|nr:hypothetical protein [bacterium]